MTRFDGQQGSEIAIYKEGDANTVAVAESVRAALNNIQQQLPQSYALTTVYDQSEFISGAINDVKSAGIIGGLLAMLIIYLFLRSFWPTFRTMTDARPPLKAATSAAPWPSVSSAVPGRSGIPVTVMPEIRALRVMVPVNSGVASMQNL